MSAGRSDTRLPVNSDISDFPNRFRLCIEHGLRECNKNGLDAVVYEGYRSAELQALYYARGRTVKPPQRPVTNALSNEYSWHGYKLAVDVISKEGYWNPPDGVDWFRKVATYFREAGCRWGGEWTNPDPPHFQWGPCKPSPSDLARKLLRSEGLQAVWRAVGAIADTAGQIAFGRHDKVSTEFKARLITCCKKLDLDPNYLMAAIAFETGETFDPAVENESSGATGLIQFTPKTAERLGTSRDKLMRMTQVEQLDYVEKYFQPYLGRLKSLEDLYMAILWPAAVGRTNDYVLFSRPSMAYEQNKGLDTNHDGHVTKAEATTKVRAKLEKGLQSLG